MAVFRRPVLWNMRIDIYRDKNKTNQAWKEIGEEFGLPEKDCKKRWRDLRDRYVRERREASETTASGSAASNRRPWCHAGLMAFIDPFVASRMTTSNMPESCGNGVDESVNESEIESVHESEREAFLAATNSSMEDFVNVTENVMNETVANESVVNESVVNVQVNAGRAAGSAVAPGRKRRTGRAEAPMPAFERNLMLALERTAGPSVPTIPVVDEDHNFLLSLLPSLRRLELSKKAFLKLQIHRLMYEAEFQ
ncbi:uncharacterized protein LOC115539821 isoform X2 [Gadus morhua]|nr:uncharacterized protein LOC115539821 isoform X2 [Gadus morhua]